MPVRFAMGATSSKGIPISINAKKNASTPFLSSHHRSIIKCPYLNSDIIHYVIPGCFRNDSWRNLLFASPLTACHLSSNYYSGVIPFFLFSFFPFIVKLIIVNLLKGSSCHIFFNSFFCVHSSYRLLSN